MLIDPRIAQINAELDRLDGARQVGRPLFERTAYQDAYEEIDEHLSALEVAFEKVLAVAQGAYPAVPEQLAEKRVKFQDWQGAIIAGLQRLTQPDDPQAFWGRVGFRLLETVRNIRQLSMQAVSEADLAKRKDLVRKLRLEAMRLIQGAERGPAGLPLGDRYDMATLRSVRDNIAAILNVAKQAGSQVLDVWNVGLYPQTFKTRMGKPTYQPNPQQAAYLLMAQKIKALEQRDDPRASCSWQRVRDAFAAPRPRKTPRPRVP